nr:ATP-binding cassette domain-containing protein [uncultured Carboxylicivirga sp.]
MDKTPQKTVNAEGNIVDFNNVYIRQQEHLILQNVNFQIKPGEFVYLIGKVGTGKSSLLKTMYNELPLQEGHGFVAGYHLKGVKKNQVPLLRRKMGIVFQDFQLLSDRTVYNNLLFVLKATGWKNKKDIDKRIREVLSHVDMVHKGYKMPHQLSGGEQQRIGIARALLNEPDLILADEPTGNLDPDTSDELMLLLRRICEGGRTVIMATHNYNLLKKFPGRTIRCEDTRLSESKQEEIDFNLLD